eukprot:scaffold30495_cov71-Phaeocystis_antarctica.AAC.5
MSDISRVNVVVDACLIAPPAAEPTTKTQAGQSGSSAASSLAMVTKSQVRGLLAESRAAAPTTFHHAAAAVALSTSQPLRWRVLLLSGSAAMTVLQLFVIVGLTTAVASRSCLGHGQCSTAQYCMGLSDTNAVGRCTNCITPGHCGANSSAAAWITDSMEKSRWINGGTADYASHRQACYDDNGRYTLYYEVIRNNLRAARSTDHVVAVCGHRTGARAARRADVLTAAAAHLGDHAPLQRMARGHVAARGDAKVWLNGFPRGVHDGAGSASGHRRVQCDAQHGRRAFLARD